MAMIFVGGAAVLVAGAVIAVVAVGQGGHYAEKNPRFTQFSKQLIRRLNGEMPAAAETSEPRTN